MSEVKKEDEDKKKESESKEDEDTKTPPKQAGKSKPDGLPWVIGVMALTNMFFVYYNPTATKQEVTMGNIFLSILIWASSFVPGIRYIALIVMIPVWFRNFMVSGVPMMEKFSKGESIFTTKTQAPGVDLPGILKKYEDQNIQV